MAIVFTASLYFKRVSVGIGTLTFGLISIGCAFDDTGNPSSDHEQISLAEKASNIPDDYNKNVYRDPATKILDLSLQELSEATPLMYEEFFTKLSTAEMVRLIDDLKNYETAWTVFARKSDELIKDGCQKIDSYLGPISVSKHDNSDGSEVCIDPLGLDLRKNCNTRGFLSSAHLDPIVMCKEKSFLAITVHDQFDPWDLYNKRNMGLTPKCILKSRAKVAHTECLER